VGEDERWKLGTKNSRNHLVYVMTIGEKFVEV
jgi:hypothetical protein